ncbi:glutathione S-transferase family protein [Roseomonas sp. WA12]
MPSTLRILGRVSSINVRKVLWTCAELAIPYTREDWGTGYTPTSTPEFLRLNPNALIPVIEDEEGVLWESNTICRYLAAKHGRTDLLPAEPRARALVEQWMDWQAVELAGAARQAFHGLMRKHPDYQDPKVIAASTEAWNAKMRILNDQLERTEAFVTGDFTLADIVLGLSLTRWLKTPIERQDLPAILAYRDRLSTRSGFVEHGMDGPA